ncbi:helix-turn-helix domain-containing protein [Chryseobacterium sp. Ch-15]|uniref:Helix-turn-helix domain-containing protein n=1 Tax=Chryseobacterium muglaense TaxID=2893752 RepID=A0A9Q3V082_9FLAO|nr:helix-turn-helix domain-containing protein [Chryseobacterium muglaense]MBD3903326.1 helix-turn-helix domain-containing protein [Chryseobacterium muglaense]MCC9036155.1 helix-turn-helix domain-containing protein [Chryseobacterium muglaense]MCM2553270.1 helix-turn-helix domain-containing protein [Chryseobacterium muglaense]
MVFLVISVFYQEIIFKNNLPYFTDKNESLLNLLTIPMAVIPVIYIAFCFRALKKHKEMLPDFYSTLERINLNWLKYILLSLIVLFIIIVGTLSLSTRWNYFPLNSTSKIIGSIQGFYLLCIVFFSLRQSIIYNQNTGIKDSRKKKDEVIPVDERSKILSERLLDYMRIEKPYLDEELSLIKLSSLLNVSTNQLSQVINQNLNTTFYKFINSYRVEEVKQKLKNIEFDHYSILGIAFESGFNSKSTFNKIFKEETGMTPSQFKNYKS